MMISRICPEPNGDHEKPPRGRFTIVTMLFGYKIIPRNEMFRLLLKWFYSIERIR